MGIQPPEANFNANQSIEQMSIRKIRDYLNLEDDQFWDTIALK